MCTHQYGTFIVMVYNMAIRIDVKTKGDEVVIYIAGRASGDAATELRNICERIEGIFVLNLSHLLYADDAGIEVIRAIGAQGMEIRGASPFIQLLVDNSLGQDVIGEEG